MATASPTRRGSSASTPGCGLLAFSQLLDDVAEGRQAASAAWETMLEEFKSAHLAAQEASKSGPLVPRSRMKLQDYLDAAPELAAEIGDLDALSEEAGRALLAELRLQRLGHPVLDQIAIAGEFQPGFLAGRAFRRRQPA